MRVVILGAGHVGFQVAKQLIDENKDVVIIERDTDVANRVSSRLDCLVINEAGNNVQVLRDAGVEDAEFFISVTDSDETNMIACGIVASEFDIPFRIARVRNIDYFHSKISGKSFLGIDYIVNPDIEAAGAIRRAIDYGAVSDIMSFEGTTTQIRSFTVGATSPFRDKTLIELNASIPIPFLVAVIIRNNSYIIPSGNTLIREGDNLYLVASRDDFETLFGRIGKPKLELRKILIVGAGKIGVRVANELMRSNEWKPNNVARLFRSVARGRTGRRLSIIERDYQRCKQVADQLPNATVLNADISDEGIFEEGELGNSDLIVTTTDNQELNILTAVYAKRVGIKRSVALVTKPNYTNIAAQLGIDVPVSMINSMATSVLRYVRRGNVRTVHSISEGKVEVLELTVEASSRVSEKKIRDLRLPRQSLIVSAVRDGESLIPDGNFRIQAGDTVIVLSQKESLDRVQRMFSAAGGGE